MNKVVDKPIKISDKRSRHTFRLHHTPSSAEEGTKDRALMALLQAVVDQPALLRCGPVFPEKMAISHDGTHWIIYGEAEAEEA